MAATLSSAETFAAGSLTLPADVGPATRDRDTFTIRDLTREFAVSARTLRFYEEKGLLSPRRDGQDRLYGRRDRARLKYVLMGRCVGFSLDETRELLDLYDLGDHQVTQLNAALGKFRERIGRLRQQKADIDQALSELTQASATIEKMLAARRGESE
jgi:DNA-binding transcriptional MerR regulator